MIMNKEYLSKIQDLTVNYYKIRCNKPLWVASEFCCSEMARYLGYIILDDPAYSKAYILKGDISKNLVHDVLIIDSGDGFFMLDPTVWQFFKNKRNILMGRYKNMNDSIRAARKIYKGVWKTSEILDKKDSKKELPKLIKIIDEIIEDNCKKI